MRRTSPWAVAGRLLATALFAVFTTLLAAPVPAHADWIRDNQWQLVSLHAATAWKLSTGAGVIVAVLDSGVDADHPDLAGRVLPGIDLVDGSTDGRTDFVGHGTTVAALIAGRNDDGAGVAGIAPNARILPVRVLDKENRYSDAAVVASGIRWAVDHGASVINLSLGGASQSPALAEAIGYAEAHNAVVVACTGNIIDGGPVQVWYPARDKGVMAVAGLVPGAHGDTAWRGGLTGPQTVLSAPAADLVGAKPGGYWRVQGTSFAAPLVAGAAALIRSRWPAMSAANVINRLISTARDLGAPGRDPVYGYGEVDPLAALTATVTSVTSNPLGVEAVTPSGSRTPAGDATAWRGGPAGQRERAGLPATDPGPRWWLAAGTVAVTAVLAVPLGVMVRRRVRVRYTSPYRSPPWPTDQPPQPVPPQPH